MYSIRVIFAEKEQRCDARVVNYIVHQSNTNNIDLDKIFIGLMSRAIVEQITLTIETSTCINS